MSAVLIFRDVDEPAGAVVDMLAEALQGQRRAVDQMALYDEEAHPDAVLLYPVAAPRRLVDVLGRRAAERTSPMLLVDAERGDALTIWAYNREGMARASWPVRPDGGDADWAHMCGTLGVSSFAPDSLTLLAHEVLAEFCAHANLPYAALMLGARGARAIGLPAFAVPREAPLGTATISGVFPRGTVQTAAASEARFSLDVERGGAMPSVRVEVEGAVLGALHVEQGGREGTVKSAAGVFTLNFPIAPKNQVERALRCRDAEVEIGIELTAPVPVRARLRSVQFHCGEPRAPGAPGLILRVVAEPELLDAPDSVAADPASASG